MVLETSPFCRLIVLRHPELDVRDAAVGASHASLSRRGRTVVLHWLKVVEKIPIDAVYASDQPQCREPAAAIAAHKGLDLITEPRLRDQELGGWQGRTWEELLREDPARVRDFFSNFGDVKPPGGESLGEAVERMLNWWTELSPDSASKTLALVLPGALLSGFASAVLGMRLSRSVSLHLPAGGMGVLDVFPDGARLQSWNPDGLVDSAPDPR